MAGDSEASPQPLLSWKECKRCQSGHVYRDYNDAVQHVQAEHFGDSLKTGKFGSKPGITKETLARWLRNDHEYRTDQRLELYTTYIKLSLGHMRSILEKAKYLREGVINAQAPQTARYMLPSSLVSSLECTIMLIIYTARSFEIVHRYCNHFQEYQESKAMKETYLIQLERIKNDLEAAGRVATESMEKAKRDIMLMTFTDVHTATVSYDAVGAEYILMAVMENMSGRPLHGTEKIDEVYASFIRKLVRVLFHTISNFNH